MFLFMITISSISIIIYDLMFFVIISIIISSSSS